jgi:hypothetical protein
MPETRYHDTNGRVSPADLRSQATALRSAIADALATLEQLATELEELERRLEWPATAPPPAPVVNSAAGRRPVGALGRLSRGPGSCSVCGRRSGARPRRELIAAGWAIAGRQAICPECAGSGWQFGEKGGVPFRRASSPAPPGR